jgi:CubicO group peptidase (beta-lactamase class C family)
MTDIITTLLSTLIKPDFRALLDKNMPNIFPALSICVIHRGEIMLNNAWGWVDPEQQKYPVTPLSRFDLASVTKLFVETTFLTLVSEGKISLESKLVDVIPEFGRINPRSIGGGQDPHTRIHLQVEEQFRGQSVDPTQVTFKHLLTHTSGLPPWRDVYNRASDTLPPPPKPDDIYDAQRWANALEALVDYPFVGQIGDTIRYSDIGILLLGEAVVRINGSRLDTAVYERICQPLGLNSVTYNPVLGGVPLEQIVPTEIDTFWRNRRAWGEVHDENACGIGGIAGHAGLFATAHDVAKFGQAWLSGDERLKLSDDIKQLAIQEQASGQSRRGLGWMLKTQEDSSAGDLYSMSSYGHTGFTGTSLWIDPEQDLVSAVLTNRVYPGREVKGIHAFRRAVHDVIVRGIKSL